MVMRRRSVVRRTFTALFGVWFSLLVAEPVALRPCPMHDGSIAMAAGPHAAVAGDAVAGGASADATEHGATDHGATDHGATDHGPMAHGAMQHASSVHHTPANDPPDPHGAHQCQCLGCCVGTSSVPLPTFPGLIVQATVDAAVVRCVHAVGALRATTHVAYALPFANGPPVRARL